MGKASRKKRDDLFRQQRLRKARVNLIRAMRQRGKTLTVQQLVELYKDDVIEEVAQMVYSNGSTTPILDSLMRPVGLDSALAPGPVATPPTRD